MFSVKLFVELCSMSKERFLELELPDSEEYKIANEVHKVSDVVKREAFAMRVVQSRSKFRQPTKAEVSRNLPAPKPQPKPQTTVTAAPVERKGSTVQRTVEVRTGQSDFRNRVSMNFGGSCAITGHNVTQCLQAAHISPFADDKNNNTSNGILMSADLHLLFDNHLMSINPDTLTVHFKCNHPYAALYEGNELKAHRVKLDVEALRIHWNLFKG